MYEWQLDDLYTSHESVEFTRDWEKLKNFNEEITQLNLVDTIDSIKAAITLKEEILITVRRLNAYIGLNLSTDTTNEVFTNYQGQFSQIYSNLTKNLVMLDQFLGTITTDITQDSELAEYTFAFEEMKKESAYLLDEEIEGVLSKMSISGGDAWESLHSYLTSTVETSIDGKVYTLSEIRNLAYESDSAIRKQGYEAELAMYDKIKDPIAFSLNNIKQQVLTENALRGYDSPLDETLQKSRMDRSTLDSLISAIENYLPEFRRYLKQKAAYLGHENGLPFYDLFAPMGEASKKFTVEESGEYLVNHFRPFSDKLSDLVATFYEKNYIDFLPKKGKRGGAFCSNLPFIGQSRILSNFDGSLSSIITLAHELGHAYHGMIIQDHRPLNWSYSMPVAETASTFNETLIMNDLLNNTEDEAEQLALIESVLQDTTQIIVDIYSRYYFESKVFEAKESQFMFSNQLENLMKEAQLKAYGDGLDPDYLHPFMWVNKGHYYSTELSFYNFPYAFGGLFSRGLYSIYEENPEGFVERYDELLRQTTVSTVEDTAKVMDVDITKTEFWEKSLSTFVGYIDQFEEITNKLMANK